MSGVRRAVLGAAVVVAVLAAGCDGDEESTSTTSTTAAGTATTTTTAAEELVVDWTDPALDADLGGGYRARHCEGDAPLLCVEQGGKVLGVVELFDYPPTGQQALADRIEGLYRSVRADRGEVCPRGHEFVGDPPVPAKPAGHDGLRYGFTVRLAGGQPSERTIAWMFQRGEVVTVVQAAAYEPAGCLPPEGEGGVFRVAALDAFEPYLERLVAASVLPE